jgi:hypothetical protein
MVYLIFPLAYIVLVYALPVYKGTSKYARALQRMILFQHTWSCKREKNNLILSMYYLSSFLV